MARPFPTTFEKDSPMNSQSGSSAPISYQANVNRQKTKKWADAKPVSYGGDDWGDNDEYEYDEPPTPVPKPTGLRQQGHTLQSSSQSNSPIIDNNKKNYGDLPSVPGAGNFRARVNSFDAGDEKRNFSSNAAPPLSQQTSAGPATRFSQITGVPTIRNASGPPSLSISTQPEGHIPATGLRQPSQVISPTTGSSHPGTQQASKANAGEPDTIVSPSSEVRTSFSDYQARRDYSPTAVPAPLNARSPGPQSAIDSPAQRFPARKSSLSQAVGPNIAEITRSPQEVPAQKPWGVGRESSPGPKTDSPVAPATKALPFIRPADIYRRAEEERRQSLESGGRPSMDSLMGARPGDRSDSPGKPQLREKSSSDSLGGRRRSSFEGDDAPGAGRHLTPILEPVKERKSEYEFEGFNVSDHAPKCISASSIFPGQTTSNSAQLLVQEARRQSTSPKLPDLNRLSGFGMDMFSQPKPEEAQPYAYQTKAVAGASTAQPPNFPPPTDDSHPPRQTSIGLRSVVNQAFDRGDDSSVPATPASRTGSNVGRTDSDSTGTGGISPIMSSGLGISEATPSILEVVEEQSNYDHRQGPIADTVVPGFKPGHRRDISTPSPGNSPARTPDIGKADSLPLGQQAILTDRRPERSETPENEIASRPGAHSEQSFRPALPGGWTSYATTARTETPQSEGTQTPALVAREQNNDDNDDLTPTTTKRSPPQSALGAAAGVAFGSGAALGRHDQDSSLASSTVRSPKPSYGNDALPTPNLAMAPSGNLYSVKSVDPRLVPKLENAPAETQIRPDTVNRSISGYSGDAPPPPPKDRPALGSSSDTAGYFPSTTAPRKASVDSWEEAGEAQPAVGQQSVRIVTTGNSSQDDENERLQEEIVRRLSPQPIEGNPLDSSLLATHSSNATRESTYLPTEYGDYWASTAESELTRSLSNTQQKKSQGTPQPEGFPSHDIESLTRTESETIPIAPLSVHRSEQSAEDASRPPLKSRFSWEQSSGGVSHAASQEAASAPMLNETLPVEQEQIHKISSNTNAENGAANAIRESQPKRSFYGVEKIPIGPDSPSMARGSIDDRHIGRDAAIIGGGAALAAGITAAVAVNNQKDQPERRPSLAEEKATRVSSYPVNATPPEDEHPARIPQPYFSPSTEQPSHPPPPSTVSPINSPVIPQSSPNTSRLLAFKEIAAIKSPHQRIQTFDETRHRFAAMDSGLTDWMVTLRAQHPEHTNATGSWAASGAGPARSKLSKPAGPSQPLQQPYYQQYLNASPSRPSTPTSKPGSSAPAAHQQQGFSPAGPSKITTQQVQAKGKEFLHTAGVFGGKAGKAGKGLLAKGKNKLRGGGGDKTSPPPKPKNDRRSSWGLPLTLSKSAGQPELSNRVSREITPVPNHSSEHDRAATMTSIQSIPPQLPPASTGASFGSMSGVIPPTNTQTPRNNSLPSLPPINTQLAQHNEPIDSVREIRDADQSTTESESRDHFESRDTVEDMLGVPAPIGKNQPSWNPFNATPIAEEQGSAYDIHPIQQSYPFPSASTLQPAKLSVSSEAVPTSDRSNSEDVHFHDAVEDQPDIKNDWIMVSPEPESKDLAQKLKPNVEKTEENLPSIMHRPRGSSYDIPILPPPVQTENRSSIATSGPFGAGPTARVLDAPVDTPPQQQYQNVQQPRHSEPHQEQNVTKPEQEGQDSDSSFLPPIRRTSTFGFKFGSRQAKQRFAIEDDDEEASKFAIPDSDPSHREGEVGPVAATDAPTSFATHEARNDFPRQIHPADNRELLHQQTSGYSKEQRAEDLYQAQKNEPKSSPLRPILIQATSSEYSQLSSEQPAARTYQPQEQKLQFGASHPTSSQPHSSERSQPSTEQIPDRGFQPQGQQLQSGAPRPPLTQAHSSDYSQRTMTQQQAAGLQPHPPGPEDFSQPPGNFRRSQEAWRPNVVTPPAQPSPPKQNLPGPSLPRQSWEAQRPRGLSGSSQSFNQRPDGPYIDRTQWTPQASKTFEQPPSSAQRYPELFRTDPQALDSYDKEAGDLPPHYYQPPISREAAFLPRQQTNEYQLQGVGPPVDEPRGSPRRNSGFFKEIGGRLSRATSRERGKSISRDDDLTSPGIRSESRGNDYADSSVTSEESREQNNRRSGFFRSMSRSSTGALNPPHSRESMLAHHPGSRTDLLLTPQSSPTATQERKRSFFGNSPAGPSPKPNKLSRASTSGMSDVSTGKKKRFSKLSGLFGKRSPSQSSVLDSPQSTRELSHNERQSIESPQFDPRKSNRQQPPQVLNNRMPSQVQNNRMPPHIQSTQTSPAAWNTQAAPQVQNKRSPSQGTRNVLSKLTTNMGSPQSPPRETRSQEARPQETKPQESRPQKSSKTRRPSASGLLNGIIGRRSNQQDEKKSEDSRSQGSQPQAPQFVPPARTYTDLQEQQLEKPLVPPQQPQMMIPFQDRSMIPQERGRQISREPQYDSVPIPGGYSLVRGQGAQAVPTEYDPRGLRFQQVDPQLLQQGMQPQAPPQFQGQLQQPSRPQQQNHRSQTTDQHIATLQAPNPKFKQSPPNLSALETYQNYQSRQAPRRLSREDLIARSPARSPEGQQRPYQLSLPEDDDDRDHPVLNNRSPISQTAGSMRSRLSNIIPAPKAQHDVVQRLQGPQRAAPQLRHPESPAGYPLPEDVVFSPINPSAEDMPPPPPPKDGPHNQNISPGPTHTLSQTSYLTSMDLNRSATHRTAVSAISGMSDPPHQSSSSPRRESGGLSVPSGKGMLDGARNVRSPSPTPPSPAGTLVRSQSPEPHHGIKTTVVEAPRRPSLDLYDASPMIAPVPKVGSSNGHAHSRPSNLSQERGQGSGANKGSDKKFAELEGTKADGFQMRIGSQEEKIFYDAESGTRGPQGRDGDDNLATMSATSYPGQEWNPYGMGYDDDSH